MAAMAERDLAWAEYEKMDHMGHGEFGDRKTYEIYQPTTTLVPSTQHIWGLFRDVDI